MSGSSPGSRAWTYESAPSSSTRSTFNVTPVPSEADVNASGRRPSVTSEMFASLTAAMTSGFSGTMRSPNWAPPPTTFVLRRFIAGEPMKPATKEFSGRS